MRSFIPITICAHLCLAYGEQNFGFGVNAGDLTSLLRPMPWSKGTSLSLVKASATKRKQVAEGYMVTNTYESSSKCGGEPSSVFGYGMGLCFTGIDSNGTTVGSVLYSYDGVDPVSDSMQITKEIYTSEDCSGTHDEEHMGVPRKCWTGKDPTDSNEYQYMESSEPWATLGSGILMKTYDSEETCGDDGIESQFTWYRMGSCFDSLPFFETGSSAKLTSCTNGKFEITTYADTSCSKFDSSMVSVLRECEPVETDDDDIHISNYYSHVCI
jgi:hypothetical protein